MSTRELYDLSRASLARLARSFEKALESHLESAVHQFIQSHPEILAVLEDNDSILKSRFRLGTEYITDFVSIGTDHSNSSNPLATLIEIESSTMQLFTKSGDPTAGLTHALRQVQNWKCWIAENRQAFYRELQRTVTPDPVAVERMRRGLWKRRGLDEKFLYGCRDRYLVIAGRREGMKVADRLLLSRMNSDLQGIRIMTYDVLLDPLFDLLSRREEEVNRWYH